MEGGEIPRGAASVRGLASRRAAIGSFFRATTAGSADSQGAATLPDGLAIVLRSSRGAQALRGEDAKPTRRTPTAAFKAFSSVKDFSRVACLAFPAESADAFFRMGYARLQLLLGYVVPEFVEEEWLSEEEANKMTDGETLQGPPLHVPYRPYVVVSLNGRDVYRSAVLRCEPPSAVEETEKNGCLRGVWDERIELQVHHPYSLLRIALYDKDTSEAAVGADELLGALDFQLHLLMPQRIYDIAAFFPPFAVLDDGLLAGKEEAFAVLQGTRQLHPSSETRALLKEPPCSLCGDSNSTTTCKHAISGETDGTLYTAELDEAAIDADVMQQQQLDMGCCQMRLMLELLPHKNCKSAKVPLLDELSALLLPAPREAEESSLPPLHFPAVWSDLQDAQRKITEGALGVLAMGLYDALRWERPVLSLAFLLTFLFLWLRPQFLPATFLLLLGLLLLIISFIPMPPPPGAASDSLRKLSDEGAAAAAAGRAAAAGGGGTGASGGRRGDQPGSLKAFEMAESSDCSETSLLRSLLSSAVPPQMQLRVRMFHHGLRQTIGSCTYYHFRLCERREVIVGALWVLGAWAAVEPAEACNVARYLVLATGAAMRLLFACYREIRLHRQRRSRQHLVAIPMG